MPLFTNTQLSNEAYHALPEVGGSSLVVIHNDCPAAWKYGERTPTKALVDGIAAHVCVLEPSLFAERFVRGIDPADYPDALVTAKDIEGFLRDLGRKGYSGKSKAEVIAMALETDSEVQIFDLIAEAHTKANEAKIIVKPKDFDMINAMRGAIFRQDDYARMLTGAQFELSFISPNGTKVRWDCITNDGAIEDYKTCITSHPLEFARSAFKNGYWLKMAFQHDHFVEAFGERPKHVGLLAQSKRHPYIPQNYILTDEQLRVGRQQYQEALDTYNRCMDTGIWPACGGGSVPLPTPGYVADEYGMDDELEIEYI